MLCKIMSTNFTHFISTGQLFRSLCYWKSNNSLPASPHINHSDKVCDEPEWVEPDCCLSKVVYTLVNVLAVSVCAVTTDVQAQTLDLCKTGTKQTKKSKFGNHEGRYKLLKNTWVRCPNRFVNIYPQRAEERTPLERYSWFQQDARYGIFLPISNMPIFYNSFG